MKFTRDEWSQNLFTGFVLFSLAAVMLTIASCGSSSGTSTSSTTSTTSSSSFPSDLAITSPLASTSSTSNSLSLSDDEFLNDDYEDELDNEELDDDYDEDFDVVYYDGDLPFASITSGSKYTDKTAVFRTILAAATDAACQVTLPTLTTSTDPSCYGPALDYQNHPNGTGGSGQLPTGDLGIWTSTQTGNEACSAAKINADLNNTGNNADYVMLMTASMACLAARSSTISFPTTDGDSVSMASELGTALAVNNSGVTVTTATVTNLTDVTEGSSTYDALQFDIVISDARGSRTISVTAGMKHMLISSTSNQFKGRVWAEIGNVAAAGDKEAFSMTYHRASSTSLNYEFLSASYQSPTSSTTIFDSNKNVTAAGGWTGNFRHVIVNIDPSTGLGNFSYSWQAGNGDDKARIFNGYTNSTTGCAFFGYGDNNNTSTGVVSDNVIDGFICNWAGPGNDHSMSTTSGIAQKQCMTVNSTSGVFEVNTSKENITYAPTVSCDSSGALGVKLSTETTYDTTAVTNNLVTLSSDTDYSSYSAPTGPTIPTGL